MEVADLVPNVMNSLISFCHVQHWITELDNKGKEQGRYYVMV